MKMRRLRAESREIHTLIGDLLRILVLLIPFVFVGENQNLFETWAMKIWVTDKADEF